LASIANINGKVFVYSHCISTNTFYKADFFRSFFKYLLWRPYWWSLPKNLKKIDGLIFLSNHGCDSRFDDLRLCEKIGKYATFIPNVLPSYASDKVLPISAKLDDRNQILSVGSYDWFKGHDFSIKAYAESKYANKIPLKIFGQKFNKYTDVLRALAKKAGISSDFIQFYEGVASSALLEEYLKSVLIINGSYSECQPLVLLDAMATGVPFVSRKSGSIADFKGGICVTKVSDASMALNRIYSDIKLWESLSIAGKEYVEKNHEESVVVSKFIKFFDEITE
jgi:glycosyltransferase involved in cell wall biosynthesis